MIRDPYHAGDESDANTEKKREEIRPIIRRPSSRNPEFFEVLIKPGHYLFHEGDPADHLYVVLSGSIEIRLDGSDTVIATLDQGESFGEQAILYNGREPDPCHRGPAVVRTENATGHDVATQSA